MFITLISIKQMRAFQSQTGWHRRFDNEMPRIVDSPVEVSIPNGLASSFRRGSCPSHSTFFRRFNPKRAGIVVSTTNTPDIGDAYCTVSIPNGLASSFRLNIQNAIRNGQGLFQSQTGWHRRFDPQTAQDVQSGLLRFQSQ